MAECLADGLSPEIVSLTGFKPRPVPTCACAWCVKAQAFNGPPSLYPACRCDQCSAFKMSDMPEHYLRICPSHGVRYTVDRSEPDECQGCLGFSKEVSNGTLPDLSATY
jgi:hypothetical protein